MDMVYFYFFNLFCGFCKLSRVFFFTFCILYLKVKYISCSSFVSWFFSFWVKSFPLFIYMASVDRPPVYFVLGL